MLDILIPFLFLRSKYFRTSEVYAHAKKFLASFIHNTLHTMHNGNEKWLPYLLCSLSLSWILLKYHDTQIYDHLQRYKIKLETFAPRWILTNFSRVVSFPLIYEFLEIILYERDELLSLYLVIALLHMFKNELLLCKSQEDILLMLYNVIKIDSAEKLAKLYYEAVRVRANTPISFAILVQKLNFGKSNS